MNSKLRTPDIEHVLSSRTIGRASGHVIVGLCVIALGLLGGFGATYVVSQVDPERLVPISLASVGQAILVAMLWYCIGILLVGSLSRMPHRVAYFTAAFVLRVTAGIILAFLFQYDDERGFHLAAIDRLYGFFSFAPGRGWFQIINNLYALFGPNLLIPKVVNALLGSLLPFFVYGVAQRVFNDGKVAQRAFLFTAFLPPLVVYSAVNLKEIATASLLVIVVWFLVVPRRFLWRTTGTAVCLAGVYWVRGTPLAMVAVLGGVTYIAIGENWRFAHLVRPRSLLRIAVVVVGGFLLAYPWLVEPTIRTMTSRVTTEAYFMDGFATTQATFMRFIDISNPLSPNNLVVLLLRGVYAPSPLRFLFDRDVGTLIEALVMAVWYVTFPFAIIGLWAGRRKGAVVAAGLMVLATLALATTGVAVGSDPFRHRIPMLGLMFILSAYGVSQQIFRKYAIVFVLWGMGALIFTVLWAFLRS